ncbi:MAG: ATP-binding cassette domain-containing protein [Candidatus Omnitrophota bacterium]
MTKILETKELYFSYPDGTCALQGINFHSEKGEFIGILGGNGSGKTTLLRVLNGLLKPSKGNVTLDGNDLKSIKSDRLFTRMCTCFQDPDDQLFSPTVGEDIAFGPNNMGLTKEEVQKRVEYSLSCVGLPEFVHKSINGLSYGQKKRVCLAGVLAMGPEIILLDEPTASLDPMGVSSIMHLLKEMNVEKGVTMIMATHSVDLVPLFLDRVVILDKGRVVKEGLPQDVFADADMLRSANLRLTQIGHLFEILKKRDRLDIKGLPLTIGQAREELKALR